MSASAVAPRAPQRARRRAATALRLAGTPLAGRLFAFFGVCAFATLHWAGLFDPAPTRRLLAVALVATCCGAALALSAGIARPAGPLVRVAIVILMAGLGLVAVGIRAKLLYPAGWGTLSDRVTGGLSVVGSVSQWPYNGPNTWLRLTTLAAAPLVATIAAALAFWPPRRGGEGVRGLRFGALALLLGLYGVAVAAAPFSNPGLRGFVLLVVIGAWLWLPRLRGRDLIAAAITVAVAGLLAAGLTSKLASTKPWLDYRSWSWTLHHEKSGVFDWHPTYGPINWPRKGTTVLLIKSKKPYYWRAQTLDDFDGFGWTAGDPTGTTPRAGDIVAPRHRGWSPSVQVTVRGLRSELVIAPGTLESKPDTSEQSMILSNGTYVIDGKLKPGDSYTATSYVPNPTPRQMRSAPPPDASLAVYTGLEVPDGTGRHVASIVVPLRGVPGSGSSNALDVIQSSRYARIYKLARSVTRGAATEYQVVKDIGQFLEAQYAYDEHPPQRRFPLDAFLFEDKIGYCQQFSGAAALMLRMLGIPSRVVAGFAPGTLDKSTHEYVVRDLDAHSWIEVWFEGIGWVTFDPTPGLAPASSQLLTLAAKPIPGSAASRIPLKDRNRDFGPEVAVGAKGGVIQQGGGTPWVAIVLVVLAAAAAAVAITAAARRRRLRRRIPLACGDPDVDHLLRLLARLGLDVSPSTTLLGLEERLRRLGGPDAAGYARVLRERRFGTNGHPPPDRAERRRLRHVVADAVGAGRLTRLQLALPENPASALRGLKLGRLNRSR